MLPFSTFICFNNLSTKIFAFLLSPTFAKAFAAKAISYESFSLSILFSKYFIDLFNLLSLLSASDNAQIMYVFKYNLSFFKFNDEVMYESFKLLNAPFEACLEYK